jgi:hypothetical protein
MRCVRWRVSLYPFPRLLYFNCSVVVAPCAGHALERADFQTVKYSMHTSRSAHRVTRSLPCFFLSTCDNGLCHVCSVLRFGACLPALLCSDSSFSTDLWPIFWLCSEGTIRTSAFLGVQHVKPLLIFQSGLYVSSNPGQPNEMMGLCSNEFLNVIFNIR